MARQMPQSLHEDRLPFDRFQRLARKVIAVPKTEVGRRNTRVAGRDARKRRATKREKD